MDRFLSMKLPSAPESIRAWSDREIEGVHKVAGLDSHGCGSGAKELTPSTPTPTEESDLLVELGTRKQSGP